MRCDSLNNWCISLLPLLHHSFLVCSHSSSSPTRLIPHISCSLHFVTLLAPSYLIPRHLCLSHCYSFSLFTPTSSPTHSHSFRPHHTPHHALTPPLSPPCRTHHPQPCLSAGHQPTSLQRRHHGSRHNQPAVAPGGRPAQDLHVQHSREVTWRKGARGAVPYVPADPAAHPY